ncbi:hypothetical protein ZIOFF_053403 [Zingiber officinale]|uniref:Uncharacterized protein n=1 Tax=Zingiber officinale TaxID=94328 RepID=A0A8J5KIH1_ZINOF|nr:hypothetical protein ZIOFF_053403 [Zingiber officinale]
MESVSEKERADGTWGGPVAESLLSSPPTLTQSRRLHNFSFPTLSWGGQRVLRCLKLSDGVGSAVSVADDQNRRTNPTKFPPAKGSPGVLERREGEARGRESERNHATAPISETERPWNLRTRRAACNAPVETRNGNHGSPSLVAAAIEKVNFSVKTLRMGSNELEKGEMIKFSVSLSRREIEEDFFAIKGTKPPRRPKKRAKIIQRELDFRSMDDKDEKQVLKMVYSGIFNCQLDAVIERVYIQQSASASRLAMDPVILQYDSGSGGSLR